MRGKLVDIFAAIGHSIRMILIDIHVQNLDNYLCLGFPSTMIIDNVRSTVEFTGRHNSQFDIHKIITKY